ncbi:MAG: hypothetical protein CMF62_13150 [Magnetococcales bacterium]|nr:hypothetical protein [Magnetococcales bacterium]
MSNLVTATFKTRHAVESPLRQLEELGVKDKDISLILTDETRGNTFGIEESSKAPEGFAAGATVGGLAGVVLGALAGASVLTIPGVNLVVFGTAVSATFGAAGGATTGALLGALIGSGINEHEAKIYEKEVKQGSALLAVKCKDKEQHDAVEKILEKEDAYNVAA